MSTVLKISQVTVRKGDSTNKTSVMTKKGYTQEELIQISFDFGRNPLIALN